MRACLEIPTQASINPPEPRAAAWLSEERELELAGGRRFARSAYKPLLHAIRQYGQALARGGLLTVDPAWARRLAAVKSTEFTSDGV